MSSEMHTDLVERFNAIIQKVNQDKRILQEIQDRSILEMIFSNNTRDLARISIGQNELISDLHQVIQDILALQRKNSEKFAELWQELAVYQRKTDNVIVQMLSRMIDGQEQQNQLQKKQIVTEQKLDEQVIRQSSSEQLKKLRLDICDIARKKDRTPTEQFLIICRSLKKFFADFSLTHNNKREIINTITDSELKSVKVSASALNQCQSKITEIFQNLTEQREQKITRIGSFLFKSQPLDTDKTYTMQELVSEVLDAAVVQEGDRYSEFRDELVTLLEDFLNKNIDVDGEHAPELTEIQKRLLESQFEIALVGEFQGGKSTTFNMLCDGREISPRGQGVKTSAAVITVQNIAGNETRNGLTEWAEIDWLDLAEIKRRIICVVKEFDCKTVYEEEDSPPVSDLSEALKAAWGKAPQGGALDRLQIATLQCRMLENPQLKQYFANSLVPIDEFQKLVVFPTEWDSKWENEYSADFTLEESLFSVVNRVLVRIHSDALAHLGCRLTDCPGLFVSQWDTERAIEVMKNANAIWYLLDGNKQIGESDPRALQRIKDNEWQDKCFFSINQRKSQRNTEDIRTHDLAILKRFGIYPEKLFIYDALTAFRCAQIRLAQKGLSARDLACLNREIKNPVSQEKSEMEITRLLRRQLTTIEEDDLADMLDSSSPASSELLARLRSNSGIQDILTAIEKMIVTEKARSILVRYGSERCLNVLNHINAALLNREDAAKQTVQEAEKNAQNARLTLNNFIEEWQDKFSFLQDSTIDAKLLLDFYKEYDEEIKSTISKRAIEICKKEWHSTHINSSDVNSATEKCIGEEFSDLIKAKLGLFLVHICERPIFRESVLSKLTTNLTQMKSAWEDLTADVTLFDSIDTANKDYFSLSGTTFNIEINGKIDVPWYSWELLKDIFTLGLRRFVQTTDDRIEDFFKQKNLVGDAYDKFKGATEHQERISQYIRSVPDNYDKLLKRSFGEMKQRLESNIAEAKRMVEVSIQERENIAKAAKETRINIVEPYSEKLKLFTTKVERYYAE